MVTLYHQSDEAVFRAIADPTRRGILRLLRDQQRTVGEIAQNFATSRPAISKHLRLLRSAGLVVTRQQGTARICELNAAPLRAVSDWISDYEVFWSASLGNLKRYVEENLMSITPTADTITQEITINAPAARVFAALTTPDQCVRWWGIEGRFKSTGMESDLRPGGKWVVRGTRAGDGGEFIVRGEYREIKPPHLLSFTWLPDWEEGATESLVRFDLLEANGVTTLRLTHSGLVGERARIHHQGWAEILDKLQKFVEAR